MQDFDKLLINYITEKMKLSLYRSLSSLRESLSTAVYENPVLTVIIAEFIALDKNKFCDIDYVSQITVEGCLIIMCTIMFTIMLMAYYMETYYNRDATLFLLLGMPVLSFLTSWASWSRWYIAGWTPVLIILANETEQAKRLPYRERNSYLHSRFLLVLHGAFWTINISSVENCIIIMFAVTAMVHYYNLDEPLLLSFRTTPVLSFLTAMLSAYVPHLQPLLMLSTDPKNVIVMTLQGTIMFVSHGLILKSLMYSVPLSSHVFDFSLNAKSTLRHLADCNRFIPKDTDTLELPTVYSPARPLLKLALLNDKLNHTPVAQRDLIVKSMVVHGCLMTEGDIRLLKLAAHIAKSYFYTLDLIEKHGSQAPHQMVVPEITPCIVNQPVSNHIRSIALGPCGAPTIIAIHILMTISNTGL